VRRLRWPSHEATLPKHPYRDSAIIYGCLAGIVVVIAAVAGRSLLKATIAAVAFFVAATLYSWWRVRQKQQAQKQEGR
jgi:Flp pilus assembly protein TadB